jgi:hypothetical protein
MNNHYKPPNARLADSRGVVAESRPRSINIALVLIALFVLVECYHQVMRLSDFNRGEISGLSWLVDWVWVGVIIATGFLVARGTGWARWVLLALMLWQILQLADSLLFLSSFESGADVRAFVDPVALWMLPMSSIFSLAATILVFGPGRGWFNRG